MISNWKWTHYLRLSSQEPLPPPKLLINNQQDLEQFGLKVRGEKSSKVQLMQGNK